MTTRSSKNTRRTKTQEANFRQWSVVMQEVDADNSGTVSEEELLEGVQNPIVQGVFETLKITADDLTTLFRLMDDGSHVLDYHMFIDTLMQAMDDESPISRSCMRMQLNKIELHESKMETNMRIMTTEIITAIHQHLGGLDLLAPPAGSKNIQAEFFHFAAPCTIQSEDGQHGGRQACEPQPSK
mmetsp:Transcript_154286/g.493531  ORF Transcript_154286/g.493531 Transcript_154286/m.493531 type:complete len:184 (-) Transcript_154286:142-693(-)